MQSIDLTTRKAAARTLAKARRDAMPVVLRGMRSYRITTQVLAHPAFATARMLHVYLSMGSEVDSNAIIAAALAQGKRVCVPVWQRRSDETPAIEINSLDDENFRTDVLGGRQPHGGREVALHEIDAMLVPMLAFDGLHRLGHGKGYYDRLIAKMRNARPDAWVAGLAFQLQAMQGLPIAPHDQALDVMIIN